MPAVGTTNYFPRKDNVFKKKESLPFDEAQAKIWLERPVEDVRETLREALALMMMGFFIGVVAFLMKRVEEFLIDHVIEWM